MSAVRDALHTAARGENLSEQDAAAAMGEILRGESSPALISGLLVALRMKGETVDEVVGFARAMRAAAPNVTSPGIAPGRLVDTCGTGGDGLHTFNISTVAAFVVAGAGVAVAKHGNRSISSRCGSADVLEALGANVNLPPAKIAESIEKVGFGFLFAPAVHPAMKHAGPVRAELKMRTVFNMLGPLTNPAGAGAQVMGVFDGRLARLLGEALKRLGVTRAFVVHGADGLDEISMAGPTLLMEVSEAGVSERTVQPADFGLPEADSANLAGGDADENAGILRSILGGETGPRRDIVLANASAALVAAGVAADFRTGVLRAEESIDSGAARGKFEKFVEFTRAR